MVDVTSIVSATLTGEIPDSGFRISFQKSLEDNNQTYFVKRFGSRTAYDETRRPKMLVSFDDSIQDDTQNLTFDTPCFINLYNNTGGNLTNIVSGSSLAPVVGSNCILLRLTTPVSGGSYDLFYTGSQFSYGSTGRAYVAGTYQAVATVSSFDPTIADILSVSSSISFTPIWTSTDASVAYVTGSSITFRRPTRTSSRQLDNYVVSVIGLKESYDQGTTGLVRVNIQDYTTPLIKVVRLPVELPGVVVKNAFYQIRDSVTNEAVVPFDDVNNSTKISSDSNGMFFNVDTSSLDAGKTYVIDIMISHNGTKSKFMSASPIFRVEKVVT
jgi:hypothetical protein